MSASAIKIDLFNIPSPRPAMHPTLERLFGKVVYSYTRAQALADGFQVDVSETAAEAGIRYPVFLTRTVFDAYVKVPPDVRCQDETGRLWDIVSMLRFAIMLAKRRLNTNPGTERLTFKVSVRNRRRETVTLLAAVGALDHDRPEPAITVMLPEED